MFKTFERVKEFFRSHKQVNLELLGSFEEMLYETDMDAVMVELVLNRVKEMISLKKELSLSQVQESFSQVWLPILGSLEKEIAFSEEPIVVMVVGINGVGKTTTVAKMARFYQSSGKRVLMVAADTFRAAATEQLEQWGDRLGIEVFQGQSGSDPSSVVFDAIGFAQRRKFELVCVDTAGRMHTDRPLMAEIGKMKRVIQKRLPQAPHEILIVIDANTGNNALLQCRIFHEALGLTGIIVSKLDGTAKGGMLFSIARELSLPVAYLGLGEKAADLIPFNAQRYLDRLFENEKK